VNSRFTFYARESARVDGVAPVVYLQISDNGWETVDGGVPHEGALSIYVNGFELATLMCSPVQQKALAIGFLANEGLIQGMEEVRVLHLCAQGTCADVWLSHAVQRPTRTIITSGCGGGITFDDFTAQIEPLSSQLQVTPAQIVQLMRQLNGAAQLHREAGGVHTSALSDGEHLLHVAEDIGRHNTLDKLRGMALMNATDTRDRIMLSSGRVTSEMIIKSARIGVPVVVSRTSPSNLSIALARAWNVTLIGYVRGGRMSVYTGEQRMRSA